MRIEVICVAVITALAVSVAAAQEGATTQPPVEQPPIAMQPNPAGVPAQRTEAQTLVPLKVTVVLSRWQGDKKISSMPYILGVTANSATTNIRMASDVPIGQSSGELSNPASGGFTYRSVGTSIDCQAFTVAAGLFRLAVTVSDSSVQFDSTDKASPQPGVVPQAPIFRNFKSSFTILLRDGQTTEYTSAVDPVTGEVMRIDMTLNLLK